MRFQTKIAELLDKETATMPDFADINWKVLGERIGISPVTLKSWYDARLGSQKYLQRIDAEVLGKLSAFFNVPPNELVVAVSDDTEAEDSPQFIQKPAVPALAFAG